jgi:FlaA1/EpsC-like NDP-sugar epimerase
MPFKIPLLFPGFIDSIARTQRWGSLQRLIIWLTQIGVFSICIIGAFLLRFEFTIPNTHRKYLYWALLIWIPVKIAIFRLLVLDRGWWRFVSIHDLGRLALGNSLSSLLGCALMLAFGPPGFPRSLYILDLILCFLVTAGQRAFVRVLLDSLGRGADYALGTRIFIYGAGSAGVTLLREIRSSPRLRYAVCGFIDDNPRKRGVSIQGIKVLGSGVDLPKLIPRHRISEILIALPNATGPEMVGILSNCYSACVKFRTIPAFAEIIESNNLAAQIREVAVEDLLGRTPVRLEENQLRTTLEGKVVLVTGAAGSIGSELCRQIARFHPAGIVGFEIAESPLFEIEREMRLTFPQTPFYPEIGSIQNRARLDEVMNQYSPTVVYHAAAYKHVPMMEAHVFEAIENNVFGTYNVGLAAAGHGVETFVMISSDKAVRPTNVMGATKRIAELLLLAMQGGQTKYVAVRFGNVLGSNGSVIPIFKKQIAAGGPVTVTHPEMRRFFMTIPEACQLVLQASAIGEGGQICVLDMGEPVKIVDLARNLILLTGLRLDEDIKIEFTGMRPGEKLYEELSTLLDDTVPSAHEKIRIFVGNGLPEENMMMWLDLLRDICETRDAGRLVIALKEIVVDYSPSAYLLKRVIAAQRPAVGAAI